jgi:hypothetical protein
VHRTHAVTGKPAPHSAGKVLSHCVACSVKELSKGFVVELARWFPGIDPVAPERLTSIYVADASDHALVEHHHADGHLVQLSRSGHSDRRRPFVGDDVRS